MKWRFIYVNIVRNNKWQRRTVCAHSTSSSSFIVITFESLSTNGKSFVRDESKTDRVKKEMYCENKIYTNQRKEVSFYFLLYMAWIFTLAPRLKPRALTSCVCFISIAVTLCHTCTFFDFCDAIVCSDKCRHINAACGCVRFYLRCILRVHFYAHSIIIRSWMHAKRNRRTI